MGGDNRKYEFHWDNTVGADMELARPKLGPFTRVEVYRLFQFSLRDVLEQHYGTEQADALFREAGVKAGEAFFSEICVEADDISELVKKLTDSFTQYGIGILRVEKSDEEKLSFVFTVDEDLDCSGLPDVSDVICVYDEGFIQGILKGFSGLNFKVQEVDCWCSGGRTCRFTADVEPSGN